MSARRAREVEQVAHQLASARGASVRHVYSHAHQGLFCRHAGGERARHERRPAHPVHRGGRRGVARRRADRRHLGPGPHRPARPAAEQTYIYDHTGRGRERLHHRHRHPPHPHRVRRPRGLRLRRRRRRQRHDRLQRPRHPRRRHHRRHHLRRRQGRHAASRCACSTARAPAPRRGVIAGIDWVTANHVRARRGEHEPRRRRLAAPRTTRSTDSIAVGVTYAVAAGNDNADACNYSPARTPAPSPSAPRPARDARASYLQLRHLRGHLRAGLEHHLGLEHERHRHQHHQRHLDGHPARRGRGGALPVDAPHRDAAIVADALFANSTAGKVIDPGPWALPTGSSTPAAPPPATSRLPRWRSPRPRPGPRLADVGDARRRCDQRCWGDPGRVLRRRALAGAAGPPRSSWPGTASSPATARDDHREGIRRELQQRGERSPSPSPSTTRAMRPSSPRSAHRGVDRLGGQCDTVYLLNGRAGLGPEQNQPNTLGGTCLDGTAAPIA